MSEHSHKDPVRIVYHAGDRTFARLFNECSLEEVKNVVRNKLGLEPKTDVSLKQMGSGMLLDLEDDDDFQAFRVLLKTSVSADIQVTVQRSQHSTVASQPREQPSTNKQDTTTSSRELADVTAPSQLGAHPEAARTSTTPAKTQARKRKALSGVVSVATPDQPTDVRTPAKPISIAPVASAKTAKSPAVPEQAATEEPQKKRRKKEPTKKDVETTEVVESPAMKASAPKTKARKSAALNSKSKDIETSEPPVKKRTRVKKDDSVRRKKTSASLDQDAMDRSISQPSQPVNGVSFIPEVEDPAESSDTSESVGAFIGACASVPRTAASAMVQSEVAAAILSVCPSNPPMAAPPKRPVMRTTVRKYTKKSSTTSSVLPVKPTTVMDAPVCKTPNVPMDHRPEQVIPTNEPLPRAPGLNGPPCPICLGEPFHIRYYCPTVLKGPDAIRERLEELKGANTGDQQLLISQLEGLLRDARVSQPTLDDTSTGGMQSGKVLPPPDTSLTRTPTIPSNSRLSEVTVEDKDEGSSSDSSDDTSGGGVERQEPSTLQKQKTPEERSLPSNGDLEAIVRGPALNRQSILHLVDQIVDDEGHEDSGSEESEAELEEDPDDDARRSKHRSSRRITYSSDTESEEEDSGSPSLSRSVQDTSSNPGPGAQGSNKPVEEAAEHQDDDVVMTDCVDPPALEEQRDGSSEETHVGSEDRMVVDKSIGEKDVPIVAEERLPSPIPSAPLDGPNNEPRGSGITEVDLTSNRDGSVPVAVEVLGEVAADPIEPADDMESPNAPRLPNADPIEAPAEGAVPLLASVTQSTPKPGVSKRIKTRNGEILDDEADRPVLVEHLVSMAEVTPAPAKGKSRGKVTETSGSQKPTSTRRSPRFSSVTPSHTSTPVVLLAHRSKLGARSSKAAKTPAKQLEKQPDVPKSGGATENAVALTPSLNRWETLPEPSSPSVLPDEPSVFVDELMTSSPQPDGRPKDAVKEGRTSSQAQSSQGKERSFDPSSGQIPFPYSQKQISLVPAASPNGNGKEGKGATDVEEEPKELKKRATRAPSRYRTLSQLASQATLFSPSLPTPVSKFAINGKVKKRAADEDSSSSSSSDADEADGSEHIPRGRKAGSVLETKKRKSLLDTF